MRLLLFGALALAPGLAWAHSPIEGLGIFFNGILHPLFVPTQLLLVLALGLLLGQHGLKDKVLVVLAYLAGLLAGLALAANGQVLRSPAFQEGTLLVLGLQVALLVVIALPQPRWLLGGIALAAGVLLGLDSAQADLTGRARFTALFGSGVSLYLLLLYPAALAESAAGHRWLAIGVRILGSWISAATLLVLALQFAPRPLKPAPEAPATPAGPRTSTAPPR